MSEQRDPQPMPQRRRASEHFLVMLAAALLVLAVVPWIAASCLPRPLLPAAFAAERAAYETRVAVSQEATRTAQRHQDGEVAVTVIGAVEDDYLGEDPASSADAIADGDQATGEDQTDTEATGTTGDPPLEPVAPLTASVTLTATTTPTATVTPTPTRIARRPTAGEASAAVRVLGTVAATLAAMTPITLTARVVVQTVDPTRTPTPTAPPPTVAAGGAEPGPRAAATSAPAAKTPAVTTPAATTAATLAPTQPARPGMVAVEDVIDAAALRDQLTADADSGGLALRDLTVRIAPDGLRATGQVQPVPLLWQPVEVVGTLAVVNESLVFQATSIRLNGRDVTSQYTAQLEDSVDSSLYRLLPQRFVQSFTLEDGLVTVQSWVRRQ